MVGGALGYLATDGEVPGEGEAPPAVQEFAAERPPVAATVVHRADPESAAGAAAEPEQEIPGIWADPDDFYNRLSQAMGHPVHADTGLERSIRDTEAYLARMEELATLQPGAGERRSDWWNVPDPVGTLHVAPARDREGQLVDAAHNFRELPARLELDLDLPDHHYVEHLLVRWIDTAAGEVVAMEIVESGDLAGSLAFSSSPDVSGASGSYRVELYDGGRGLEFVTSASIAIGPHHHVAVSERR